jgi:hypothetical protein
MIVPSLTGLRRDSGKPIRYFAEGPIGSDIRTMLFREQVPIIMTKLCDRMNKAMQK